MAKVSPRTLSGFMELLPREQMKMERMMEILRRSYASYGFTPLDTPVIESAEVLLAKGGGYAALFAVQSKYYQEGGDEHAETELA